jgi:hypothetical protein
MPEHEEHQSPEGASTDERSVFRRHARIWLATLSTVVGVATGMFTLRDEVFPAEAGSASAVSVPVYQQQVGKVCDTVNDNDRVRAHQDGMVRIRLQRAQTTLVQRNALLDGVRRVGARSGHALASFSALAVPTPLAATSHEAEAAWNRNLARLRGYAARLDRAGTRAELVAAIDHLSGLRPLLAADGLTVASALERLGGANCDLRPPRVTATFTLPSPPKHERAGGRDVSTPGSRGNQSGKGGNHSAAGGEAASAAGANTPGVERAPAPRAPGALSAGSPAAPR